MSMAVNEAVYRSAVDSANPLIMLRSLVAADLANRGGDRESLLAELEALRVEFREAGRDDVEDVVLEVMDFVTGWCSPHMRI
jgi:hypothetical protein